MKRISAGMSAIILLMAGCCGLTLAKQQAAPKVEYHNAKYGLTFPLAESWRGYSVVMQTWHGTFESGTKRQVTVKEQGPVIVLRHPKWKATDPYQDIPIYVFTQAQWAIHQEREISIHAGGMDYELAHNDQYVFAIYSRFNVDDSVKAWEETGKIVDRNLRANHTPLFK